MVNILVPTDFSSLSKIALQYAIKIANQINGSITLLHVITITQPVRASMHDKIKDLEEDLIIFAERDLTKLSKEVCKSIKTNEPLKYVVVRGSSFIEVIQKEAKRLKIDLIVMGTRGATGLKKTVVGSNTTSVIEFSQKPVLAVPDKGQFRGFKDVVYASDLKNLEKELRILMPFVLRFNATLHLLHITPTGKNVDDLEEKIEKAAQKLGYKNIVTLVLVDSYVEEAIDQYISVCKADLLTMFTHNLNFYEKVFDKSMTRKMAFHSSVPLLAFKGKAKSG
jgi:nucleotide-binding universal stress UspA family protein